MVGSKGIPAPVRPSEAGRLALSADRVDQICGIQQGCCLIEELLDVESDFEALLMKARTCTGVGGAPYSRGLIKPVAPPQSINNSLDDRSEVAAKNPAKSCRPKRPRSDEVEIVQADAWLAICALSKSLDTDNETSPEVWSRAISRTEGWRNLLD
jgi:hypothetical protein